jgi:DNA processing protein
MKTDLVILHLSLIDGIGSETIKKIVYQGDLDVSSLYQMQERDLVAFGVHPKQASMIVQGLKDRRLFDQELDLIERYGIKYITLDQDKYPFLLKHIYGPPPVLYYKGADFFIFDKNIAVIGSRKANHDAAQIIQHWVSSLVKSDWVIVSGGAIGADTMAHQAALDVQGRTVVVLGSGLLSLYPRSNVKMFEKIVDQGGAVVSSFALRMAPHPSNFPARNRIISGLSKACLVVQAAKKSGATITAEYALEQGRMVFAVPGSVFDPLHEGCHAMIKEGATLISSVDELMAELGEVSPESQQDNDQMYQQEIGLISEPELVLSDAESVGQRIIRCCLHNVMSTDDLLHQIDIPLNELYDHLFNLQLAGKIEQDAVGLWRAR